MNDFCCLCVKIAISVTAKVCMCAVDSKMQDDSSEYVRCPLVDMMPLDEYIRAVLEQAHAFLFQKFPPTYATLMLQFYIESMNLQN